MESPWVKALATAIMLFGLLMSLIFGGKPVDAILLVQRLTLLTVPALALALLWASNSKAVVGDEKNGIGVNAVAGLGFAVVLYLFVNLVRALAG